LFTPFIPDATVLVTGKRPAGQPIAKYKMTRNANNPSMAPGAYMYISNKTGEEAEGNAPSIGGLRHTQRRADRAVPERHGGHARLADC
jgi:hypothetical protein